MDAAFILDTFSALGAFFFWLMVFFIFYHLTRFGIGTLPKRLAALFLVGAVTLFSIALLFFTQIDLNPLMR